MTQKQASGRDILQQLFDYGKFRKLHGRLYKEDRQSADLMLDVYHKLADRLDLSRGEQEALNRVRDISDRGVNWDVGLLRNNIFKAANSMGMKLPSGMFASQHTAPKEGSLVSRLVRLAYVVPETRKHILPLIKKAEGEFQQYHAQYKTVNDAAFVTGNSGYNKGRTEIWYMKPSVFRDFIWGPSALEREGTPLPTAKTVKDTHILLGNISENKPEKAWQMMQGEVWSPDGQANGLIRGKGLRHTSMSVGDIVKIGNQLHMADIAGFKRL